MAIRTIPAYVLSATPGSEQEKRVLGYLNTPLFKVFIVTAKDPTRDAGKYSPADLDFYRIKRCLQDAARNYPDSIALIIKDTSVSDTTPQVIADYVKEMVRQPNWDLGYLTTWGDKCQLQSDSVSTSTGYNIVKSFSPNGVQALLIKPNVRDMILGKQNLPNGQPFEMTGSLSSTLNSLVREGQLKPAIAKPNLFNFDQNLAKSEEDKLKAYQCSNDPSFQQTGSSSWIWALIIIVILIFLALIFIRRRQ